AYRMKAVRLGRAEDPEAAPLLRAAHDLLWTAPCDLAAAEAALAAYQRAVVAAPGRPDAPAGRGAGGEEGRPDDHLHRPVVRRARRGRLLHGVRPGPVPGADRGPRGGAGRRTERRTGRGHGTDRRTRRGTGGRGTRFPPRPGGAGARKVAVGGPQVDPQRGGRS